MIESDFAVGFKQGRAQEKQIMQERLDEAIEEIEQFACDEVTDQAKAQGMCDALTMLEEILKK